MKSPFKLTFVLLLICGSLYSEISEETILRDCKGEYALGAYKSAVLSINRFLRNYPKSPLRSEALYLRGLAFLADSKRDSAKVQWEMVSEKDHYWYSRALLSGAAVLSDEKEWRSSNDLLRKAEAVSAKSDSALLGSIWHQLSVNSEKQNKHEDARAWRTKISTHLPRSMESLNIVGIDVINTKAPKKDDQGSFSLQLGAFQSYDNALSFMKSVEKTHKNRLIVSNEFRGDKKLYIVYVNGFKTEGEAQNYATDAGLKIKEFRIVVR